VEERRREKRRKDEAGKRQRERDVWCVGRGWTVGI
jgi:hypothetical protein